MGYTVYNSGRWRKNTQERNKMNGCQVVMNTFAEVESGAAKKRKEHSGMMGIYL